MKINKFARLKITGYNLNNLLNTCISGNIELLNVKKISLQQMEVSISDSNLKLFKNLNLDNYEIQILLPSVKDRILHFLLYRIGLIVGIVASVAMALIMQNRLFNINIYGVENIEKEEIIQKINEYGIDRFDIMDFDCQDLEKYLMDNFDLSFVSIITRGNSLIINAKEELPDISNQYVPITAEYNMIVKDIKVYSGTSGVNIGDIVFAGDELILPYEIINGEKVEVAPCAEIYGEVYFCASYDFFGKEEVCINTGESQVIGVEYYLGKYKLFGNNYECKFQNYEIEEADNMITNYFLPIHIKKIVAYEKSNEEKVRVFEDEKEDIVEKLKVEVYKKVPSHLEIESEDIKINSTNYGNIVTIYLKSSVYLKYNSN